MSKSGSRFILKQHQQEQYRLYEEMLMVEIRQYRHEYVNTKTQHWFKILDYLPAEENPTSKP
jgi:hypothetical protein